MRTLESRALGLVALGLVALGLALAIFPAVAFAVPSTACAPCHRTQVKSHGTTAMAHALKRIADSEILRANPLLSFRSGAYSYTIKREGDRSIYTVTNGAEAVLVALAWAFGSGLAGQTYVFERDGVFYESRVSFYRRIGGLDLTLGNSSAPPRNIVEAAGRKMPGEETRACFGCHAAGSVKESKLSLDSLIPGLQCESCHAGADRHLTAIRKGDNKSAVLPKLGKLNAEEMSDLCGQCHRTWADIAANGPLGIRNLRFPAYRLANSKCYDGTDARIRCTACHDPHAEVDVMVASYDSKCLACHSGKVGPDHKKVPICRAAKSDCVKCHMPTYEIPGSHHTFSDHQIRIVRTNEPYPN